MSSPDLGNKTSSERCPVSASRRWMPNRLAKMMPAPNAAPAKLRIAGESTWASTNLGAATGHVRTSATAGNAEPSLATAVPSSPAEFVAAARTPAGDCAVFYLPVGGTIRIAPNKLPHGLTPRWFDPRTGKSQKARTRGRGILTAPDPRDWVLLLQR